ncbi:EEF1A lysine methyltransferase 4-like isoform X3 [Coffea eugenioides]|nr:EEF1A lysine methyltransferase 4-like isoform X3 [Coffea eugenioides]
MVKDGYEDIMNIDISSVAIDMMRRKYEQVPQMKYMKMDVRDMSFFPDDSFHSVIDKGTLDSLMCGNNAPISAVNMLGEITYGDPTVRIPHLNRSVYSWKIELYIIPRPGFQKPADSASSAKSFLEPVPITEKGQLPADYVLEDPDSHFIYICKKTGEPIDLSNKSPYSLSL